MRALLEIGTWPGAVIIAMICCVIIGLREMYPGRKKEK